MRLALICCAALAMLWSPAAAEMVKIMTWNPEFLWDGVAPEDGSSGVHFPWKGDPVAAASRMDRMARVISAAAPDVAMLQEVEGAEALQALASRLPGYNPVFVQGRDTFTGQDIGLLTRRPLETVGRFDDVDPQSGKGVSKNLVAFATFGSQKVAIIGLHLLSRASDPARRADREAQARATVAAMAKLSGRALIVVGDFNDYDGLIQQTTTGMPPVTQVLSLIKDRGTATTKDDLVNALAEKQTALSSNLRWTNHWDRDNDGQASAADAFTAIDHILIDPALKRYLVDATVLHSPDAAVSDHRPVLASFDIP